MSTYNGYLKKWDDGDQEWDILHPKTIAENIVSGTFLTARIPTLAQSKITDLVSDLAAKASKVSITGAQKTKITYNAEGIVTAGENLGASDIPALDASKITTGTFNASRLPKIAMTDVKTHTTLADFIANEYWPFENMYVDMGTSDPGGTIPVAGGDPEGIECTTPGDWTSYGANYYQCTAATGTVMEEGDVLILSTDKETYIHNGGDAGSSADFTKMETPTDVVTSVAGETGVVTVAELKTAMDLTNVDNTSDANKPVSTAQQTALNLKANKVTITGAQKTKITYNSEGIVTAGENLVAADIPTLAQSKITDLVSHLAGKLPNIAVMTAAQVTALGTGAADKQIVFETA